MIGNASDATYIRDWYVNRTGAASAPAGWRKLGEGMYRVAFRSPDGVVYKVQDSYVYSEQNNLGEYRNWNRLRLSCKLPQGARWPRLAYYGLDGRGVIAMEYVGALLRDFGSYSPDGSRYWGIRSKICRITDMWDLHGENVGVDTVNDEVIPIDLAED